MWQQLYKKILCTYIQPLYSLQIYIIFSKTWLHTVYKLMTYKGSYLKQTHQKLKQVVDQIWCLKLEKRSKQQIDQNTIIFRLSPVLILPVVLHFHVGTRGQAVRTWGRLTALFTKFQIIPIFLFKDLWTHKAVCSHCEDLVSVCYVYARGKEKNAMFRMKYELTVYYHIPSTI